MDPHCLERFSVSASSADQLWGKELVVVIVVAVVLWWVWSEWHKKALNYSMKNAHSKYLKSVKKMKP